MKQIHNFHSFNANMEYMDIDALRAFVTVAANGSFSQSAEHLHLTQPAVSKRIAGLENELEVRLFDRLGRRVLLTEAGRTLLPHARRILAELEDSRRALSNLAGEVSGRLRLATSHHVGLHRLPPLLRSFAARYPAVQLDIRFTDSELACGAVSRGEVELAVVTLPTVAPERLICQTIWDDPLEVCAGYDHPLVNHAPIEPAVLVRHPAILPGEVTFTRRIVDRFFQARGLGLREAFSTNYLETIKTMVVVGLGWSVLPRTMIDDELRMLTVPGWALCRALGVIRHTGHTLSNAARAMLALLQAQVHHPSAD